MGPVPPISVVIAYKQNGKTFKELHLQRADHPTTAFFNKIENEEQKNSTLGLRTARTKLAEPHILNSWPLFPLVVLGAPLVYANSDAR